MIERVIVPPNGWAFDPDDIMPGGRVVEIDYEAAAATMLVAFAGAESWRSATDKTKAAYKARASKVLAAALGETDG